MKRTRRKDNWDWEIALVPVVSVLVTVVLVRTALIPLWPDPRRSFWVVVAALVSTPILAAALGTTSLRLWWRLGRHTMRKRYTRRTRYRIRR